MPRKKAETTPQEEFLTDEQAMAEPTENSGGFGDGANGTPENTLFPELSDWENPFSADGSTYVPLSEAISILGQDDAESQTEGGGDESEKGTSELPSGFDADQNDSEPEATEGYGELLTELSETVPEEIRAPESAPLLLAESDGGNDAPGSGEELSAADRLLLDEGNDNTRQKSTSPVRPTPRARTESAPRRDERVLTIHARDEVESDSEREATLWHEIQNSYRTRHILSGTLDTVERTDSGLTLAVVNYNGFRVAIPAKEMLLNNTRMPSVNGPEYAEQMALMARRLYARLGSEIDFIVKGIENRTRSIVASRMDAMYRKRQTFYMDTDAYGRPMIYEGRIVQARVVAVAEKVIRVEVFGVECSIRGGGISRAWYGNANESFAVGDLILVRVLTIQKPNLENIQITADVRSVTGEDGANLNKCVLQGHYVGRITDIRSGVYFIRLNNGVNAVAHSNYDLRTPGKRDDVSFVVTRLDPEHGVAVGIITRIIRQNL